MLFQPSYYRYTNPAIDCQKDDHKTINEIQQSIMKKLVLLSFLQSRVADMRLAT